MNELIRVEDVFKSFNTKEGEHLVLDGINLTVKSGEVLALLGKSGSGKSTLLRCIAGLMQPSKGVVYAGDKPLRGPNPQSAMVFQTFALLPWLTVQKNVELGLEARSVPAHQRETMALRAIDLIGLDGYEDAFPKELSGGMRQRVGFARALVTEPDVLLMDEPFSALDVLTAENLRGELIELIGAEEFTISSVVIVTHNIEEAVILADRVAVLGSNPGRIIELFGVDLPRPRDRDSKEFIAYVNHIYALLTAKPVQPESVTQSSDHGDDQSEGSAFDQLPMASVDGLAGLADILHREGKRTIAHLADDLGLEVDDLLPQIEALELLGFAEVSGGKVKLTKAGTDFAAAPIRDAKVMFSSAALQRARIVEVIVNALTLAKSNQLSGGFFRDILERRFSDREALQQFKVAVSWGRYAELYSYDADHDELTLDVEGLALVRPQADAVAASLDESDGLADQVG